MKKIILTVLSFVLAFCCAFGVVACGDSGNSSNTENSGNTGNSGNTENSGSTDDKGSNGGGTTVAVTEVTFDKYELTLEIGKEETLTATVKPDNATNKTVIWEANPKGIVTVTDGKVKGLAEGSARVTASAGGKSATCLVTVKAASESSESGKVTAGEWESIIGSTTNFTLEVAGITIKITDDKQQNANSQILLKEGDNYYQFWYYNSTWTKRGPSGLYENLFETQASILTCFKDYYSEFTYSDGKYTCAKIENTTVGTATNIEVTFDNGVLVGFEFDYESGTYQGHYVTSDIGTTVVELPTDYVDNSTDSTPAVAGKTYVFYAFEGEGDEIDEETKAMVENSLKDAYYTFGSDGSVTAYKSNFVISDNAKYQQVGNEIRMYTYPDEYPNYYRSFTYNGDEIFYEVKVEGMTARYIYRLQTSD